jgi:acetyl-CoA carboxylase biotin carboxyl carrier protein
MNVKEIKELIALMNENGLTEVEIENGGFKIKLKKTSEGVIQQQIVPHVVPAAIAHAPLAPQEKAAAAPSQAPAAQNTVEIKSSMVGTFYRAPSPEAPPYVDVGQNLEVGQVVCIVEAMKLMNEIKSEVRGKIVKIFVDNGQPVEFGQPLFLVEQ